MGRGRAVGIMLVLGVVASLGLPAGPASAAPGDVVISEMMFNPLSDVDGDEFIEITNPGATPVDVSGWCFNKGITGCFAAGTTMPAGGRLVLASDAARFQVTYGFAPAGVYTGTLSNGGETVTLVDSTGVTVIDSVKYTDRDPWPTTTDGTGPSLELIDPTADNANPVDWAASTATGGTPGAANSVAHAGFGLKPVITTVVATPAAPAVNQPVVVTANVTGQVGSPVLRYRVDVPLTTVADQTVTMTPTTGTGFSATIPGAAAGHLIRYRVEATNPAGANRFPRDDDSSPYAGVVVASGVTSAIPVLEWFINDADYNQITASPTDDISAPAVLAYRGTVFDNVQVNIRGQGTQTSAKPNWKFEMPQDHDLTLFAQDGTTPLTVDPVDEFAMQADFSDKSHGRPLLAWDSYATAGVVNAQVFPVRTQRNAAFQGLYTYVDLFDGTWRDREGFSDDQVFKAGHGAFDATNPLVEGRFEKKAPDDNDFSSIGSFLNGVDLTGTAQRNHLLATADIPNLINFAVVTALVQHTDSSSKNFYLIQNSVTGRWEIIPWDLDHTFGNTCCNVISNMVTPAEPGDQASELMTALLAVPEWKTMYFRRLRTVVNSVLATGRLEGIYDAKVGPAAPEFALDFAKWPGGAGKTFANQRTALFKAITARRTAFASDARVPANQSAAPNIVINEIKPSPVAGDGTEFVELYNPSATEAIDLSGWSMTGGLSLTVDPGTVILPQATMTFVGSDPTFRASYGTSAFVGGTYTGNLAASGPLALLRADGTTADSITYGGAGWPTVTGARSLELVNPAADNNVGSNWALSTTSGGSPGAVNQVAVVGTVPGAPTIGSPTAAGDGSATARWTAPASTGGTPITGYQVNVVDSVTGLQVGGFSSASSSAASVVISGLTKGTAYKFSVSAINNNGVGAASALSNAVTPPVTTAPGAPVIGTATQGAAGGALTATAAWAPPTNTGGSAITNYIVTALRVAPDGTVLSSTESPRLGASVRSRQFTLIAGNYRFVVVAVNIAGTGTTSARSNSVASR
jgi:CotH kinase protein/Lamin Tail Domain/Fibronectin type III domain